MSGKDRRSREKSKEDTWKASELKTYINPHHPASTATTTTTTTNATRRGSNRDRSDNTIGHDVTPKSKGGVTSKAESLRADKPPLDKVVRHDIGSNEQKRGTERHEDRLSTKDRTTGDLSMQVVKRRENDEKISDHVRGNEHLQRLKDPNQRAQIDKTKDKTRYRSEERTQIDKTKDKTRYRSEERTQIDKTEDKTRSSERILIEKDSSEILKGSDHKVLKTSQSKHKSKQHEQAEKESERRHTSQERELSKNITSQSKHKLQEKDKIDRTSQSKHRSQKREQIHKTGDQSRKKSQNQAHIEKTSQSKHTLQEKEQNAKISQSKLRSKLGGHLFEKRQADMTGSTSSLKNMSPKISERYKFDANRRTSSEQNLISTQNVKSTLNFDRIQPVQDDNSQNDISEDLPSNQSDDNISDSGANQNFNKFDQNEDEENTSYVDDFEVYDEDFEENVSSQDEMNSRENDFDDENDSDEMTGVKLDMNEILAAIDQENQSISAVKSSILVNEFPHNDSESSSETDFQITQTGRTFINFHSSKMEIENREINLQVQSRSKHLKNLIELDFANFDIFNLEPETDYEIYIKHFGFSLSNQVAIQCCQEVFDREQQTDEIISREKWIQHAENGVHLTGGGDGEDETTVVAFQMEKNTQRFLNFFEKASQVICILLEENTAQARNSKLEEQNSAETDQESIFEFSTPNYFSLKNPPILEGRDINYVHISNIQPNSVLISYSTVIRTVDNNMSIFNRNGVIALWNINDPHRPKKILVCETDAKVCAFSPQKLSMAFAGLSDGSIVLWDLGENQEHFLKEFRHHEIPLRTPTYSTAMLFESGGHFNPICALEVIYSKTTTTTTTTTTEIQNNEEIEDNATAYDNNVIGGLSFQIASLDTKGVINIWVISEVFTIEKHGSLSDLKLAPGGRLKLTRATSISIVSPIRANSKINSLINSTLLKFHPEDANHYFIGAENGLVIHGVRHAGKHSPKAYFIENNHQSVSSIEFHPWLPDYFAVGYRFSCFAIYNRKSKCPVFTVNDFDLTIIQLFWSKTNPSQLFILSEDGLVSLWDLLVDTYRPIAKGSVARNENDWLMIVDIKLIPKRSHAKKSGEIIISYSDGTSEIHVLKEMRDSLATGDLNEFKSFLDTSQIFTKTI